MTIYDSQDIVLASLIDLSSLGEEFELREEYFSPEKREIFECMKSLYKEKGKINHALLQPIIATKGADTQEAYLKILGTTSLPLTSLGSYIEQIRLTSNIQRLKQILLNHLTQVDHSISSSEEEYAFIFSLQKEIEKIYSNDIVVDELTPQEKMKKMYEIYKGGGDVFIPTKFASLDHKIQGFFNSSFVVIGARPSVGKTSFALSLAKNILEQGYRVGFFSIEMSDNQIHQRLASQILDIPLKDIIVGKLKKEQENKILNFCNTFDLPFYVDAHPLSLSSLRIRLKKMKNAHKLDIIFLDYLQLISGDYQRYELVTKVSQDLKVIAKELDIPIVVLSQLSRGSEQTEDKIPNLSHLRESGSIEQDADMVMLLYREEKKNKGKDKDEEMLFPSSTIYVDVAKNRNGQTGKVKLTFDKEYTKFKNF